MVVGAVGVAAVALYFGLGMPGMDHGEPMSSIDHTATTSPPTRRAEDGNKVQVLDPSSFAARTTEKGAVVVNVHVPFEGGITGTDLSIPFDQIASQVSLLPADRDTPLLVYCRSGRMSKIAATELVRLGYRDVADLDGGMLAWEKNGRTLVQTVQGASVP